MANEIGPVSYTTGTSTLKGILFNSAGEARNVSGASADTFEAWADGSIDDYDFALSEKGTSGIFYADLPSGLSTITNYTVVIFNGTATLANFRNVIAILVIGPGNDNVNVTAISGDTAAADNLEAAYDGAGYAGGTIKQQVDVTAISGDSNAADNLESACDNYSATRGLAGTALPNAAADAAGGLPISDAGGLDLDTQLTGTLKPTVPGRTLDVSAAGNAGIDLGNVENQDAELNLENTTIAVASEVGTVTGNVEGDVEGGVQGNVGGVNTSVTVGTNNDKTGYSLSGTLTTLDAVWTKIVKLVRAILRSDAATTTDSATEIGEINANAGSGAGDFSNTTDSLEAVRDRGDAAWVTGIGGSDAAAIAAANWSYTTRTLTGPVRIVSPLQTGEWAIVRGDTRLNADGNAQTFTKQTNAPWPTTLTSGWSVRLEVAPGDELLEQTPAAEGFDCTGTVVSATAVQFDITATDSDALSVGRYKYRVVATKSGSIVTLESGTVQVAEDVEHTD